MYLIVRNEDGAYVSDPATNGTGHSYARDLRKAKCFPTRDAAEADACGNETVRTVESQLSGTA